jgi:omega-6 fatty acid desaturase (delta-12 desaturase)
MAGAAGIWLFYVHHRFEDAYWAATRGVELRRGGASGQLVLRLPRILQFFTGNIGLHHVHHLGARIPDYNLQAAHDACMVTFREAGGKASRANA